MTKTTAANKTGRKIIAENRRARFDYEILETFEAGLVLTGTEIKGLRTGRASLGESYATTDDGNLVLVNAHIPEYKSADRFNHEPRRARRLLLHRKQIDRLCGALDKQGLTVVPLRLYFNERGRAKLEMALARGRKRHDKREVEKTRSWQREKARLLRRNG